MPKRIVFVGLTLFSFAVIAVLVLSLSSTSSPSSPMSSTPRNARSTRVPSTPIGVVKVDAPDGRLQILNRELGIPLDQLQTMSIDQIDALFEQNAACLQVNIGKLVPNAEGTEVWVTIQGRNLNPLTPAPTCVARSPATPTPSSSTSSLCPSIQRGLAFLQARYNPTLGLLAESPVVAPHKYWLTNDNALAAYALSQLGNSDQAATITKSLQRYGHVSNGLIEVVWGVPVSWPPRVARPVLISQTGLDEIWQEFHDGDGRFDDWSEYANLAFLAALNENALGHSEQAQAIFAQAMQKFDGSGFRDKAYTDHYETYKLALALYVSSTIHAPTPASPQLLNLLLSMQSSDGGFTSLYRDRQTPLGDANTETTAFALLALSVYGCAP